jgi:DNA (cytosine-5)-methyltransferase 1
MANNDGISAVDLFCGAGGLTHGLLKAGIPVQAGIDIDARCRFAYEANNNVPFVRKDIATISSRAVGRLFDDDIDLRILAGCAPCQPFSSHTQKMKNRSHDIKWTLLYSFCRLIRSIEPEVVSMENVPNLVSYDPFKDFVSALERMDYCVNYSAVNCEGYGVPQYRRRLVLFASKLGTIMLPPPDLDEGQFITVRDIIGQLDKVDNGVQSRKDPLHRSAKLSDVNLQRISESKPGGSWLDWPKDLISACHQKKSGRSYTSCYGRMEWDRPSPTITTQFYNYGSGRFGHPEQNRALTLREGALLQTFPEDYGFIDSSQTQNINCREIGVLIGNAVPVKLGQIIGSAIKKHVGG